MKENNFDIIRLFAAGLVFFGHSFIFFGHTTHPLFLSWAPLGPLGVYIFFVISGYLVTESWERDPNLLRFFARRMLRIFPGLAACLILSAFILGPILTTKPLNEYFTSWYTYLYCFQNIFLHISYYLPGLFETNKVANAVNGSLWSLPIEFFMYSALALIGFLTRSNRWVHLLLGIGSAAVLFFWAHKSTEMIVVYATDLRQVFICGTYFWLGSIFYKFNLKQYFSMSNLTIAFATMICLDGSPTLLMVSSWILLPTIVLSFGLSSNLLLRKITSTGDYSYGIYIYAFPIQQAVICMWPNMSFSTYLLSSGLLTLFFAVLSWHFVEKPALALKPKSNTKRLDLLKESFHLQDQAA